MIKRGNKFIKKAVIKYGICNFAFVVLEIVESNNKIILISKEQYYFDLLKPTYNIYKVSRSIIEIKSKINSKLSWKTEATRIKISINSAKSKSIQILENNNIVYTFKSIKDCAEYFYNDPIKRIPIRWAIKTGKLLFNKYKVIIKK